jgi:antitoxin component YwqK of YwqJK toxin-antitoxin module
MKKIFILSIFSVFIFGCHQNDTNKDGIRVSECEKVICYQKLMENGKIEFESRLLNDEYIFDFIKFYYPDGSIKEVVEIQDTVHIDSCCKNANYQQFYPNGNLKQKYSIKGGLIEGTITQYDSLGNLQSEKKIQKNKREGISRWYFPSGKVLAEIPYKENRIEGKVVYYQATGDTLKYYHQKNGNMYLPAKIWNENRETIIGEYLPNDMVKWIRRDSLGSVKRISKSKVIKGKVVFPEFYP